MGIDKRISYYPKNKNGRSTVHAKLSELRINFVDLKYPDLFYMCSDKAKISTKLIGILGDLTGKYLHLFKWQPIDEIIADTEFPLSSPWGRYQIY